MQSNGDVQLTHFNASPSRGSLRPQSSRTPDRTNQPASVVGLKAIGQDDGDGVDLVVAFGDHPGPSAGDWFNQTTEGVPQWLVGICIYDKSPGTGSVYSFEAEQLAMFKGLNLAWDLGFRRLIMESDSKELVDDMRQRKDSVSCSLLSLRLKEFLSCNWELKVELISRNQNQIADSLAKEGLTTSVLYDACPQYLRSLLDKEALGSNPI